MRPPPPPSDDARVAVVLASALLAFAVAERLVGDAPPPGPLVLERHIVDLNSASADEIEALPGVGPVLAARIVAARGGVGFASADDLRRVPGLGPATIERLRPFVRCAVR